VQYWCEYAWLGGLTATPDVLVTVDGGVIAQLAAGAGRPPRAVHLRGLTLPGLANTHSHAFQRALRGTTQTGGGSFWTWREQMYALAATIDPDSLHSLARATFAEMVQAGITCVGEFHYLHHAPGGRRYDDPVAMEAAVVTAAREAGLRITLLDVCYLHGGIGVELDDVQRRFSDGDVDRWSERVSHAAQRLGGPGVRIGAAAHSVRALAPPDIAVVAAWATARNAPLHAHVSEQRLENEQCVAAYGTTPVGLFAREGVLSPRFSAVHATHVSDGDVGLLAAAGATVSLCPTTERDLADGIAPGERLRDAGVAVTVGSDSQTVIDLLEEARLVDLHERLASGTRGVYTAAQLAAIATENGHRSLGWEGAGRLAVGAPADLVSVRLDSVRTAGSSGESVLDAVMFAATAADVHHVVVDGEVVVRDGRHVRIDVAGELAASIGAVREALGR
jgi:formiminoglutamate deiminase